MNDAKEIISGAMYIATIHSDLATIWRVCHRLLTPQQCATLTDEEEAAFGRAETIAKAEGRTP